MTPFDTPVVLFIFNRPDTTAQVVEALRAVRPERLFVVADGPRPLSAHDQLNCAAAFAVLDRIDWKCEIIRNIAEVNLGCGKRVSSGIAWVYNQVDEAIFLEDDCLPDPTFFWYCRELLARYRYDDRVMMISGTNSLESWCPERQSYHFSLYGSHWGWASWKRAWKYYDFEMKGWSQVEKASRLLEVIGDEELVSYHLHLCDLITQGKLDTWDVQWTSAQLLRRGLAIVPAVNLVSNIGFSQDATHTRLSTALSASRKRFAIPFPLKASVSVSADLEYDRKYMDWRMGRPDTDMVISQVQEHLSACHNTRALLLLEALLRSEIRLSPIVRAQLYTWKARALTALGNRPYAFSALHQALTIVPDRQDALDLMDQLQTSISETARL
jgi:hypothetical protein